MSLDELKNLDELGIALLIFSSKNNLKLHNISVTPKLDKNIITNVDLSKASGPYYIPIVVLKNCKPEFSYILVELFYMCLKESCLHIVGRFHQWSLYLRMLGKVYGQKLSLYGLLSKVSKIFEKLVNNSLVDHLEKCSFSNFQYGFLDQLQVF